MSFALPHFAFLILSTVAWFWQPYEGAARNGDAASRWKRAPLAPAPWLFGIAWLVLYILNISAWMVFFDFVFLNDFNMADDNIVLSAIFLFVTWGLLKMWYPVYFYYDSVIGGAVVIVLTVVACILSLIFLAIAEIWAAFGLLIPLAIWLLFATYLNLWSACNQPRRGSAPAAPADGPLV